MSAEADGSQRVPVDTRSTGSTGNSGALESVATQTAPGKTSPGPGTSAQIQSRATDFTRPKSDEGTGRTAVPESVALERGTRVWISVASVIPLANGDFDFEGTLLLPVEQAGAVILAKDAHIGGSGRTIGGRVSLRIGKVAAGGALYRLKSDSLAMNTQSSENANGVAFKSGRVVELFISSRSLYGR